jgi:hypothetical protein
MCDCAEERLFAFSGSLHREHPMLDVVVLAIGLIFFALSIGYCYACERL